MVAALLLVIALLVAGCGEREFEPAEFVEEANAEGASLILGEALTSTQEGIDVFALSFAEGSGSGGSLLLAEDAEAATAEFERCQAAVSLTCYRAANVVLYFEGAPTDESVAGVDAAIRALEED